jgi:hypothetical protein
MLKPDVRYQMFSFIFLHIFGKFAIFENFEYFLNFVNMNQNGITVISIIVTGNQIFCSYSCYQENHAKLLL